MMSIVSNLDSLPLYERVLGEAWSQVDIRVRSAHLRGDKLIGVGTAQVTVQNSRFARFICRCLEVPPPGEHAVMIRVERKGNREVWSRRLGRKLLITEQRFIRDSLLSEIFGFVDFDLEVTVVEGALAYKSTKAKLRFGPVSIPIPRRLEPLVIAKETGTENGTRVDVDVFFPPKARLFSYSVDLAWSSA